MMFVVVAYGIICTCIIDSTLFNVKIEYKFIFEVFLKTITVNRYAIFF